MVRYTVWFELRINYAQKAVVVHSQGVINALPIPIKKNVYNDEIVIFFFLVIFSWKRIFRHFG